MIGDKCPCCGRGKLIQDERTPHSGYLVCNKCRIKKHSISLKDIHIHEVEYRDYNNPYRVHEARCYLEECDNCLLTEVYWSLKEKFKTETGDEFKSFKIVSVDKFKIRGN